MRFDSRFQKLDCLKGLRMLDIGCGGGISIRSRLRGWARIVVGADPSEENIKVARAHADDARVTVDYRYNHGRRTGRRERGASMSC